MISTGLAYKLCALDMVLPGLWENWDLDFTNNRLSKSRFCSTDFSFLNCVGECADIQTETSKARHYHITFIRQYMLYLLSCCKATKEMIHYGSE